jgi:molybdenum cofactor biosynthesis protein MoaC
MVDITHKNTSLRTALAQAVVQVSQPATIEAIRNNQVPKGDVLATARAAGLFAAKKTPDLIPDCHPIPVEYADIRYILAEQTITIEAELQAIYRTGVEVEAMCAASVTALTIYDMLKPIDSEVIIRDIKLINKEGGKKDWGEKAQSGLQAAVIVCSDSVSAGKKEDTAGKAVVEKLQSHRLAVAYYEVIPDEIIAIQDRVKHYVSLNIPLIVLTGGTGLSPRDVTPEALLPILERRIWGIEEAIRSYGQERTPYAMLSRSVVGLMGNSLVMALPGSTRGAAESVDAVFPAILHLFRVLVGMRHDS